MTYSENEIVEENINKTAIYARLSREDNGIEFCTSIDNQIEYITKSLESFSDVNIVEVYSDNGFSGVNFSRNDWERMIEDIKSGKINCIAVKDLSRIGRNSVEVGNYLEKVFPFLKIRVISVNDNYDSIRDDFNSKMVENAFKNLMNEFYVRDIAKKINTSIEARRNMGYIMISNVGYGYKKTADGKGIIPDENAPVVEMIFRLRRNGKTMGEIANMLNYLAIPSPGRYLYMQSNGTKYIKHKDSKWFTKNISDILSNRIYTGDLVQSKTFTSKIDGINKRLKDENEWIVAENFHQALVSKEDFEYIQGLKKTICKRPNKLNHLKGKIYCGKCGYELNKREVYSDRPSFNCQSNRHKLKELCRISVSEKAVKEVIVKLLYNFMCVFEDKKTIADKVRNSKYFKDRINKRNGEISAMRKSLKELELKTSALYQDLKAEIISLADFEFIKAEYNREYAKIETELNNLVCENKKADDLTLLDEKLERLFSDENSFDDDEYIYSLVKKITVYSKEQIEVEFTFNDMFNSLDEILCGEEMLEE